MPELTGARLKMVREMIVINGLISIEIYELLLISKQKNQHIIAPLTINLCINNGKKPSTEFYFQSIMVIELINHAIYLLLSDASELEQLPFRDLLEHLDALYIAVGPFNPICLYPWTIRIE